MVPRLKEKYRKELVPQLQKDLGLKNPMQVPRIEKVVVNMGVGDGARDIKLLEAAMNDLTIISGQRPVMIKARRSVAGFRLRSGMPVGTKVTLRGDRMWEFVDRLMSAALPRIRDFRGMSANSFDGRGNYTFGVTEQLIFPEIDYDKIVKTMGMDITICTTAEDDDSAYALMKSLGFPLVERKKKAAV